MKVPQLDKFQWIMIILTTLFLATFIITGIKGNLYAVFAFITCFMLYDYCRKKDEIIDDNLNPATMEK